ncbi:MAG TPA: isoprenylcysteine carboxylmethyltransferase family protein, partial [Candidatus Thermoplasmatota archaeon]|nr:isoprenylcysteine carboxylmethyltransferase family protein [Candidatus Thermoplasmatota archaeon]
LATGAAIRIAAIRTLAGHFRYELRVEEGQGIVQRGLYARLRHPSYLGLVLIPLGAALVLSSLLGILVGGALMVGVVVARIREEESVLREAFGGAYEEYSDRTWRLVPYVY